MSPKRAHTSKTDQKLLFYGVFLLLFYMHAVLRGAAHKFPVIVPVLNIILSCLITIVSILTQARILTGSQEKRVNMCP